ncbi:UNVERIFIED_CONTAM: Retrovirus-related Pol polyprotein from transposon TNT 1-94 [Sesamum radiatum]|uniref:Retrovirus-related Pol polyprotein from transposon TNT 1-94 n=1 Tax=Sesamum radiatum TaxID=300843 RepID=A0AAW2IWF1_SESRA
MKNIPYSNAIGSVMYLMVSTRPDIAYAVSCLSRYMSNAGLPHWEALKWLLRYLNGSIDTGNIFWAPVIGDDESFCIRPLGFGPRWKI